MYRILFPSRKQDDGSNLYLNAHKIRLALICQCPNTNKQAHLSFKTEVGHPDYHVLLSSIIFSLYIFLCNRADIMQIDGMSQLRHPVAFFSFVWLLPSYCIILKNLLVDSDSIHINHFLWAELSTSRRSIYSEADTIQQSQKNHRLSAFVSAQEATSFTYACYIGRVSRICSVL